MIDKIHMSFPIFAKSTMKSCDKCSMEMALFHYATLTFMKQAEYLHKPKKAKIKL